MLKLYRNISVFALGIALLTGLASKTYAQCDPRITGMTYKNTTVVSNVATILVGQTAQLEFRFGVGQQPTCTAPAGNVAGSIKISIVFPAEYSPLAGVTVGGSQSSLYDWTYDPVSRTLVGVNNAPIPPAIVAATFTVDVTGMVPTAGTAISLTTINFTSPSSPPITNSSGGNDALSAGVNVDPGPPVANPDAVSTAHDTNVTIDVLTNDTPNGSALNTSTVRLIDPVTLNPVTSVTTSDGVYTVNADGTITFDPDPTFTGITAPVKYTVTDGAGLTSNQANITVSVSPLPVTLVSFNVIKEGNVAQLNWATTMETNSDRFDIQRSQNGKSWTRLESVTSGGESKNLRSYTYTDKTPQTGENLYRLKMIDKDETFAYSSIRSVRFEGNGDASAAFVYPNPSSDRVFLNAADLTVVSKAEVVDMSGRAVLNTTAVANGLDVSKLAAGTYILKVSGKDGSSSVHKFVIAR